jgi:hypothetical protein
MFKSLKNCVQWISFTSEIVLLSLFRIITPTLENNQIDNSRDFYIYQKIQSYTEMKKASKSILKSFAFLELRKSRDLLQMSLLF